MRLILRGLLLTAPLWLGPACKSSPKPKKFKPPMPGKPLRMPGADPSSFRAQKPEPPPVVALPPATPADGDLVANAVAYVNNMPIFDAELREALLLHVRELEGLGESERERRLKQLRAAELEKLIDREVVLDVAYKRLKQMPARLTEDMQREASREFERRIKEMKEAYKVKSDGELSAILAQQGMSLSVFRRSMERGFIAMEFMRSMIFPKLQHIPLAEVRAYYEAHAEEYSEPERAKWQDIFIDAGKFRDRAAARDYAAQVAATLRSGGDFAAAAKQLQQAGYNAAPGADGVGEKRGEIRPAELEAAVFGLAAGEVGGPVEVPGGFHIVKVTERSKAGKKPLDADTQNDIVKKLQNKLAEKEYRRLVEAMKEKALIQRLE